MTVRKRKEEKNSYVKQVQAKKKNQSSPKPVEEEEEKDDFYLDEMDEVPSSGSEEEIDNARLDAIAGIGIKSTDSVSADGTDQSKSTSSKPWTMWLFFLVLFGFIGYLKVQEETMNAYGGFSSLEDGAPDYYEVLGLPRSATTVEIKRAFRAESLKWHPDKNPNCQVCDKKFAQITEANKILSNDESRYIYDHSRHSVQTINSDNSKDLVSAHEVYEAISANLQPLSSSSILPAQSHLPWIIQVYSDGDPSSKNIATEWEVAASSLGKYMANFGRVNSKKYPAAFNALPIKPRVSPGILMIPSFQPHLAEIISLGASDYTSGPNASYQKLTVGKAIERYYPNAVLRHPVLKRDEVEDMDKFHNILKSLVTKPDDIDGVMGKAVIVVFTSSAFNYNPDENVNLPAALRALTHRFASTVSFLVAPHPSKYAPLTQAWKVPTDSKPYLAIVNPKNLAQPAAVSILPKTGNLSQHLIDAVHNLIQFVPAPLTMKNYKYLCTAPTARVLCIYADSGSVDSTQEILTVVDKKYHKYAFSKFSPETFVVEQQNEEEDSDSVSDTIDKSKMEVRVQLVTLPESVDAVATKLVGSSVNSVKYLVMDLDTERVFVSKIESDSTLADLRDNAEDNFLPFVQAKNMLSVVPSGAVVSAWEAFWQSISWSGLLGGVMVAYLLMNLLQSLSLEVKFLICISVIPGIAALSTQPHFVAAFKFIANYFKSKF